MYESFVADFSSDEIKNMRKKQKTETKIVTLPHEILLTATARDGWGGFSEIITLFLATLLLHFCYTFS